MVKFLQKRFGLTENGARGMQQSAIVEFFYNMINMVPFILLMAYADSLLRDKEIRPAIMITICLGTLAVMLVLYLIDYDMIYTSLYRESKDIRVDIARHLKELPLSYFSGHDLSDISQTIMADVLALEHAMGHAISKISGFVIFLPIISVMLLMGNLKLGLVVVIPMILNLTLIILSKKIQVKENTRYYHVLRENSEAFQETIELNQEIRAYGLKDKSKKALFDKMDESEKVHIKIEIPMMIVLMLSSFVLYVSLAIVIIVGTKMFMNGEVGILYVVGYILAAAKLKDGLDAIGQNLFEVFYIDAVIKRIREIRESEKQSGTDKEVKDYDISFENVSFSYEKGVPILKDVSFTVDENMVVALAGKSGCGKTSVLRLVSRLYDYDDGRISIGGTDIKEIRAEELFKYISIVFQDVTLFDSDFMENIRLGREDATDEEVIEAAKLANCHQFIMNTKDGYRTKIGENGRLLSGGERQRISIARAFLKDSSIIILDEIMAALDVENEKEIQEGLNRLIKGRTVIIISHRLKSIEGVDKIVVLDDGRVEAEGSHEVLMEESRIYKNLVEKAALADGFVYRKEREFEFHYNHKDGEFNLISEEDLPLIKK